MRSQGVLTGPTTAAAPWIRNFDPITQTPWLYNPNTKVYISYDDPISVGVKTQHVLDKDLAGLFVWSLEQDNGELIAAMQPVIGGNPPATSTTVAPTTTTSTAQSTTTNPTTTTVSTTKTTTTAGSPTPTSGTGKCAGIAAWNASTAYNGGAQVTYNGNLFKAQWWTQGETPSTNGPAWSTWTLVGAC